MFVDLDVTGKEEGALMKDASNPENAAHNHVDPHGFFHTTNASG